LCLLALVLTSATALDAQVAIQAKNGTTWTSTIELKAVAPVTFRWRWDGTETPTGVAWQVATVTPTSTATTRTADVVAGETPMRLSEASGAKGAYTEFTVTPEKTWPAQFYIRVRVTVDRKAVYSRWIAVSVVQRTDVAANPLCTIEATNHAISTTTQAAVTKPIASGEKIFDSKSSSQHIRITFKNRLTTPVSYRRAISIDVVGQKNLTYNTQDPQTVHDLGASGSDSFEAFFAVLNGKVQINATATPSSGSSSKCSFVYEII
jgi:hypothetical protein